MIAGETNTLIRLSQRRFQSFSEAAEVALGALAEAIPGTILLGRLEPDEQVYRVVDVRGVGIAGLHRGAVLPVLVLPPAKGDDAATAPRPEPDTGLNLESMRSFGAQAWVILPLETSDGVIVGSLCALDTSVGTYRTEHAALLGIAAVLLSHEWESVQRRAELRRLRVRLGAGERNDPDTGLVDREGFLELLDREWRLVGRGTHESVLATCTVEVGQGADDEAARNVALKVAAEVLHANARDTDLVGRIGPMTLAAILVGCRADEASAFVERFQSALERVTRGRPFDIEVSFGIQSLAGAPPPQEVLSVADGTVRAPAAYEPTEQLPQEATG